MSITPYEDLNVVLHELVSRIESILGKTLIGIYLQGSFAVGDFDEHSDVDFIVVMDQELSSDQVNHLQEMHDRLFDFGSEWAKHLEGSYFPAAVLRSTAKCGEDVWYLDHGARSLIRSDHCNTLLVRWVVRESGVILYGPPPETLIENISTGALKAEIYKVMHTWGKHILEQPSTYNNRFYQGYIVLNYSRMLHDLIRGIPGSKREGADWAKAHLDPQWIDLIDNAWDCRPDPARQVREPADPQAYERTVRFLRYVLDESQGALSGTTQ